jgi:hypothetical protein
MTGAAAHILDVLLAAVDLTIAHDLKASVTVGAVQRIFAAGELSNGLVVIMQAVEGLIGARVELDVAQAVIAAVMTGITLRVGNSRCELVDSLIRSVGRGGMAG